jgi:hypothetical protein
VILRPLCVGPYATPSNSRDDAAGCGGTEGAPPCRATEAWLRRWTGATSLCPRTSASLYAAFWYSPAPSRSTRQGPWQRIAASRFTRSWKAWRTRAQSRSSRRDASGAVPHYQLLDTIRPYALQKLTESGKLEPIARPHAEYHRACVQASRGEREVRRTDECRRITGAWTCRFGQEGGGCSRRRSPRYTPFSQPPGRKRL